MLLQSMFGSKSENDTPRLRGGFFWDEYDAFVRWRANEGLPSACKRRKLHDLFQSQWSDFGYGMCSTHECPLALEVVEANDLALDVMVEASSRPQCLLERVSAIPSSGRFPSPRRRPLSVAIGTR